MKISMICFSLTGMETGEKLKAGLKEKGWEACLDAKSKYLPESIKESTKEWAGQQFEKAEGIVFIGAAGIAVRSIAPYVQSKKTDPAVLVIDECGNFVISLLAGHLGGANALTRVCAGILDAVPVVTTATDLHHKFAVDVFAKENGCHIFRMREAKEVSAALLAGEPVGFYSEFPWEGKLPKGLVLWNPQMEEQEKKPETGIALTIHENCRPFTSTTHVVPKVVALGMGCRKNKEAEILEERAEEVLKENEIYPQSLFCLASIDIKKEEPGLIRLAEKFQIPFLTFSGETLQKVEGDFTASAFVNQTVGVDNVCERSALYAAGQAGGFGAQLIQKKQGEKGVTTALALGKWRAHFE